MAKIALIAHLIVTAAALTAGCSHDAGSRSVVATRPVDNQAETLVRSCAETTRNLASAHVVIGIKGKFGRLPPIVHIDADVQAKPPMANGEATYDNGTVAPFVVADDTISLKVGDEWSELGRTSAFVPPNIIEPSQVLPTIMDSVTSLQSAGTETIDEVATRKVTGTALPAGRLKEILPDATHPAAFTAWIREGGDPVLVRTTVNVSAEQSLTVSLSKWNAPVLLTPAPTA